MSARWAISLILILLVFGCQASNKSGSVPRPDRGYLHWLEKESLFGQTADLLNQVSQTERLWLNSGVGGRIDLLLKAAPTWLEINPAASYALDNRFQILAKDVAKLPALGLHGLYLGPTAENVSIWLGKKEKIHSYGTDAASFNFAPEFGAQEQYEKLLALAENAGVELGSDMLAASTGMGPDFLLQARGAPASSGIYAMFPVDHADWHLLPEVKDEWETVQLDSGVYLKFAEKGLVPFSLARDDFKWAKPGGWAVTGEITGFDGQPRRWIYRFLGDKAHPVFLWQDPFARAKRIFSAAVILQTGLRANTLVGLRMEALMGMEPGEDTKNVVLSPGLEALNDLAMQIHRFGGWALQADILPIDVMETVLQGPCDFCRDDHTYELVQKALAKSNARELTELYEKWLQKGVEIARLARGFNSWQIDKIAARKNESSNANIPLGHIFMELSLGLPGLVFVDTSNFSFLSSSAQEPLENSMDKLISLANSRFEYGLGYAKLTEIIKTVNYQTIGFVSKLPEGGFWLTAINFGSGKSEITWDAPKNIKKIIDAESNEILHSADLKSKFGLVLDGYQCRNVVIF